MHRPFARSLAHSLARFQLAHIIILLKSKRGSATPNYRNSRIRRRRRRIRRCIAGSVSFGAGTGSSGYGLSNTTWFAGFSRLLRE